MRREGDAVYVPTWEEVIQAEPRIMALIRDCETIRDGGGPTFCAKALFHGWGRFRRDSIRTKLELLVGFRRAGSAGPDWLFGLDAYNLAYRRILDALPPCRDCVCQRDAMIVYREFTGQWREERELCITPTA